MVGNAVPPKLAEAVAGSIAGGGDLNPYAGPKGTPGPKGIAGPKGIEGYRVHFGPISGWSTPVWPAARAARRLAFSSSSHVPLWGGKGCAFPEVLYSTLAK